MRKSIRVKLGLSAGTLVALSSAIVATPAQAATAAPNCIDAAATIRDNFGVYDVAAHHNSPDQRISHNDMVAVAGGNYAANLRDAAGVFSNNQRLFDALDTAAKGGGPDNRISPEDVAAFIARGTCG
ncbi:hypothetical protein [Streptomyces nigrescens]